jgi:hypothetical protein
MPGCRDAASLISFSNIAESKEEVARMNFCAGLVVGLSFMGQPYGVCVPPGTTSQQTISIVVQYIDGQPARTDEDFRSEAATAAKNSAKLRPKVWEFKLAETATSARLTVTPHLTASHR